MKKLILILSILLSSMPIFGQLPNCNVYAFDIIQSGKNFNLSQGQLLTHFNVKGYNNQPCFIKDKVLLMTTNYYDVDATDIVELDLNSLQLSRKTKSQQSEYSAVKHQYDAFSTVRVESDNSQVIWAYDYDEPNAGHRLLDSIDNVGYYQWIDDENIALFLVDEPNKLNVANIYFDKSKSVIDNIGRTLKTDLKGLLYFVHQFEPDNWYIKTYNHSNGDINIISKTLDKVEDFELYRNRILISAKGSILYALFMNEDDPEWLKIADLSVYGIQNISRIAIRKNKLVVVENE